MNNKDKIAETTFLLSLKNGFYNVSIKQIQDESGLAASSIYYHIKDKNDILLSMVNKYIIEHLEGYKEVIRNFKGYFIERLKFVFHYILGSNVESGINFLNISKRDELNYKNYYLTFMGIYHQHQEVRDTYEEFNKELYDFYKEQLQEAIENKEI